MSEDFVLSDGRGSAWKFTLDGGASAIHRSFSSEDRQAVDIRSQGRQIGEFDEQRNWKNGHGHEYFSDDPEGYYNGANVWTVNKNLIHNSLLQRFGEGLRKSDFDLPDGVGGVDWQALFAGGTGSHITRYVSCSFVASSSYSADRGAVWVRRVGTPGTFTLEICADSAGSPGTVAKTVTKTITDVTQPISILLECDWTTTTALVSGTTYHIKVYGASTDNADNHWEVGVDVLGTSSKTSTNNSTWATAAFSMYYRVVDAEINRRMFLFDHNNVIYACSQNADGTASKLYINGDRGKATSATATTLTNTNKSAVWVTSNWIGAIVKIVNGTGKGQSRVITANTTTQITVATWDITPDSTSEYFIYKTSTFTEITSTGLGYVTAVPVSFNGIVYFPQGATTIRRMRWNPVASPPAHEFADDTANIAQCFVVANDVVSGAKIWRGVGTNVGWSAAKAWGTALVFTAVTLGGDDSNYGTINNMVWHDRSVYIFKDGSAWSITGNTPTLQNWGLDKTPSQLNGAAAISDGNTLYFSRLHSTMRVFGGSADDVGISWRGTGLAEEKQGAVAWFEKANGWIFQALDAGGGAAKVSSVHIYDGLNWHELFDAPIGKRVRCVKWQSMADDKYRLWIDIGSDLMYIDFPPYTNVVSYSSQTLYQHEAVILSSVIDMGTSARLPKYIRALTAITENLGDGKYIAVDYQFDQYIGTAIWVTVSSLMVSPEDTTFTNLANIRRFRYRLRMMTNSSSTPIIVRGVAPNGLARVPYKLSWTVRVVAGEIQQFGGGISTDVNKMLRWLDDVARYPGRLRMTSEKYPLLDDYFVVISPPEVSPTRPEASSGSQEAQNTLTFSIMEI